jgi:hypothetical protein
VLNIEPDTISRLAEIENVRAVKQAWDDLAQAKHIVDTGLDLYAGDDNLVQPFLELGGRRRHLRAHARRRPAGRRAGARDARRRRRARARDRRRARAAYDLLKVATNPIAIKAALNLLGHDVGGHRLPLVPRPTEEVAQRARLPRAARLCGCRCRLDSSSMSDVLRVIPLGGLGEVGKNMTVFETGESDRRRRGLAFPRDEHLGVDLILPDFGYLADAARARRRADARARGPCRGAAAT